LFGVVCLLPLKGILKINISQPTGIAFDLFHLDISNPVRQSLSLGYVLMEKEKKLASIYLQEREQSGFLFCLTSST
jgi:hypothetical protein